MIEDVDLIMGRVQRGHGSMFAAAFIRQGGGQAVARDGRQKDVFVLCRRP